MYRRIPGERFSRGRIPSVTGGAAPAPPVTPLTIYGANLAQWVRSDLGITIGTGVSAWADQTSNGLSYTQGTGGQQFAYTASDATLNNVPTLLGDGIDDVMSSSLVTNLATDDFYLCFIVKQVTWTISDALTSGTGTTMPRVSCTGVSPNLTQLATVGVNGNAAGTLGSWWRMELLWTTTAGVSYHKIGATQVQTGNPGTGIRTASTLLAAAAASFANCAIAEFFCVKRAAGSGGPTGAERTAANAYITARYGAGLV